MNYSSLAILSRCPQAPVPNLGQYDHHSISSSVMSSVPAEGQNDPSHLTTSDPRHGAVSSTVATSSAVVRSDFAAQRSNVPPTPSGISSAAGPRSAASVGMTGDDDDFDDFKTAPSFAAPLNHGLTAVSGQSAAEFTATIFVLNMYYYLISRNDLFVSLSINQHPVTVCFLEYNILLLKIWK